MSAYWHFARLGFRHGGAYRWESLAGALAYLLATVAALSVWRSAYAERDTVAGIPFSAVATYLVLAGSIRAAFAMDEFFIEQRVKKGTIALDLLRPVDFHYSLFAYTIGGIVQRGAVQALPVIVLSTLSFDLNPPASSFAAVSSAVSLLVGLLIVFELNLLVWCTALKGHSTWSYVTIKEALLQLLSGAAVPLWFFPQWIQSVLRWTPMESLLHTPLSLYTGRLSGDAALAALAMQLGWAVATSALGILVCRRELETAVLFGG